MSNLETAVQQIQAELTVSKQQLLDIAAKFTQEMLSGLAGQVDTLKMLPSYVATPTGQETGSFLSMDFGGTNVRVLLVKLGQHGQVEIQASSAKPLKAPDGSYDYIYSKAPGAALFDFFAKLIGELIQPDITYPLGHTFSFPSQQTGLNTATLLHWAKEINTTGVEGQDINQMLTAALARQGINNVIPLAICNDTVGTLLTAAYGNQSTDIGSICGTGHNTAYLEPNCPVNRKPMIINIESGNFNKLPFSTYDNQIDQASERPATQRLEKMTAGRYIGELFRVILRDCLKHGLLSASAAAVDKVLETVSLLDGADVSAVVGDQSADLTAVAAWLQQRLQAETSSLPDRAAIQAIAKALATRSARLVVATFVGILNHIDPALTKPHNIAVDGSLYEKLPGYAADMERALAEIYGGKAAQVTTCLSKDGSGIGGAIAVAIAADQ